MRLGCGFGFILIAALFLMGAIAWSVKTSERPGWLDGVTHAHQQSEDNAAMCWVGAVLFGIIGLIVLFSRIGAEPPTTQIRPQGGPTTVYPQSSPIKPQEPGVASHSSVEQRLAELKGLLAKGLISEQEYQTSRQRILDEL